MRGRLFIFGAIAVALASLSIYGLRPATAAGKSANRHCVEGAWILTLPDGRIAHELVTPSSDGQELYFLGHAVVVNPDPTLGGLYPNAAQPPAGFLGRAERVSSDTWEARAYSHAVNVEDGVVTGVAYIEVDEAIVQFPHCDEQLINITITYYDAEQDADGDGVPDPGEEPFLVIPNLPMTGVRL